MFTLLWLLLALLAAPLQARPYQVDELAFPHQLPHDWSQPLRVAMAMEANGVMSEGAVAEDIAGEILHGTDPAPIATTCKGVRPQDEIVLISSRSIGCTCNPDVLESRLRCQQYSLSDEGACRHWHDADLRSILDDDSGVRTVVFVHGNWVSAGQDKCDGLSVYRRMIRCADSEEPIRFVIFSWPSSKMPGILRDVRVKASRTRPVGCQLAWVLDQLPAHTHVTLIGYSYGARIATGALHLLGGGSLSGMRLQERAHPDRDPMNVVLLAAATHAHWLGPGQYHGHALSQVDQLLSINNCSDRVMKWYRLSDPNGNPQAMGLVGPICLGSEAYKVTNRQVARYVGTEHNMYCYLSAPGVGCQLWEYAAPTE